MLVVVASLLASRVGVAIPAANAPDRAVESGAGIESRPWQVRDGLPNRGEALSALADGGSAGLAVGDGAGVAWWSRGHWRRAQTPAVQDLAFDGQGQLWIGTREGLFVWRADARPQRRTLRDGEVSSRIARIESAGPLLVVASEGGAYAAFSGSEFVALSAGTAGQPVSWIALEAGESIEASEPFATAEGDEAAARIVTFGGEGLVQFRVASGAAGPRVIERQLLSLPRAAVESGAVDLALDPVTKRLLVVYPDAIAVQASEDPASRDAKGALLWRWIRPVLPPGATIVRVVFGPGGRVWLATQRGLLVARRVDGPFVRAGHPAGARGCLDVVSGRGLGAEIVAVAPCRGALLVLPAADAPPRAGAVTDPHPRPRPALDEPSAAVAPREAIVLPPDPPVAEIRRRALAGLGLSMDRSERLWRGLGRRALLPSLELRGAWDAAQDREQNYDQTFVSGETRELYDRDLGEGHGYAAAIVLDWELGGLLYPDEADDLSRELRQVLSLRDDVSDEIHQLYFERQRLRARLADASALAPGEASELLSRAEELDAGLDAWTNGWLGAWRAAEARPRPTNHPDRSAARID